MSERNEWMATPITARKLCRLISAAVTLGLSLLRKPYSRYARILFLRFRYSKKRLLMPLSTNIDGRTVILLMKNGRLVLGENVTLRSNPIGYHAGMPFPTTLLVDQYDAVIEIGDNTRINGAYIHAEKGIFIGANTLIAAGVNIIDSNGHVVNSENRTNSRDKPLPIRIGNNVWIGLNSIILKGATIGDNCVVAAGSVVKGAFPRNSLIAGNPAERRRSISIVPSLVS